MRRRFNRALGAWWTLHQEKYKLWSVWYGSVVVLVVVAEAEGSRGEPKLR